MPPQLGLGLLSGGPTVAAVALGSAAAILSAIGATLTKGLVLRMPARQLIGPLYGLNALLLLPAAPLEHWEWSPAIIGLFVASVASMCLTVVATFDLFAHGSAAAVTTAQALSPLPVLLAAPLLLATSWQPVQVIAVLIIVTAVMATLTDSFTTLGRRRAVLTVAAAALGAGLLTVLARLMAEAGVGVVQMYVVRTAISALLFLVLIPPRDIPARELPQLIFRGAFSTAYFVLIIIAVQYAAPAVVQATAATTPVFVMLLEWTRRGQTPPWRLTLGAAVASGGVVALAFT